MSPLAHAASGPGRRRADEAAARCALAAIAAGSTPATGEMVPSSASSPSATKSPSWSPGMAPIAAISASAIGRS